MIGLNGSEQASLARRPVSMITMTSARVVGVGQHREVFGVFELCHDELGDEPGQGPGSAGQVVVIDRGGRGQSGQPTVASAGVEKDSQTGDVGAGGVSSEM